MSKNFSRKIIRNTPRGGMPGVLFYTVTKMFLQASDSTIIQDNSLIGEDVEISNAHATFTISIGGVGLDLADVVSFDNTTGELELTNIVTTGTTIALNVLHPYVP